MLRNVILTAQVFVQAKHKISKVLKHPRETESKK